MTYFAIFSFKQLHFSCSVSWWAGGTSRLIKYMARNQSNRQNLHDDLAKVKSVSLSVIKSIKTNLVFLTKPGEQFMHAFTEPMIKEQKLFVGTVSGKIAKAPWKGLETHEWAVRQEPILLLHCSGECELAVISNRNGFTIVTVARNRHLRKRTTHPTIDLTMADWNCVRTHACLPYHNI